MVAKGQGAPGKRRGRKQETKRGTKAKVLTEWTPSELDAAQGEKHDRNVEIVRATIRDSRCKTTASRDMIAGQLLFALDQRDYYQDLLLKRTLTADEGRVANGTHGVVLKLLKALGVDDLRDEGACARCNGNGERDGVTCDECHGSGMGD